ncbi:MAG: SDR family oxidoreductase [Bacteroidota bacterium]
MRLHQVVAVVTGGTGVLGSRVVHRLLGEGARVAVPSRTGPHPGEAASGSRLFSSRCDLRSETEVERFFGEVGSLWGPVGILVNAAGGYAGGSPVVDSPLPQWNGMILTNLTSCFLSCRAALRMMIPRGEGCIVNVTARTALEPRALRAAYAASKAGVIALTRSIAEETRETDICAVAVAPEALRTEANRSWMTPREFALAPDPGEAAELILLLCMPQARGLSGSILNLTGRGYEPPGTSPEAVG